MTQDALTPLEAEILIAAATEESYVLPEKDLPRRVAVIMLKRKGYLDFDQWGEGGRHYIPTEEGYVRGYQEQQERGG